MHGTIYRQLESRSAPPTPPRRDVIRGTAAAGLLMCDHMSAAAPDRKRRVIIVGAGFAGLACADELTFAGYDVAVVEARERIGGRVRTIK